MSARVPTSDILFVSRLNAILQPHSGSSGLSFLDLKREARVLFVVHMESVKSEIVVNPICSSLISMKRGVGFYMY